MNIEYEIFKKTKINYDKLLEYGFKKEGTIYKYSIKIMDNSFRIDITINNDKVIGKIYDLSFNEEYTNYKVEGQNGEFVSEIRNLFISILNEIKEKCTTGKYFISDQANRITSLINNKYNDIPEFIWTKFPGYGILRNPNSKKWYGIILNINKNKFTKENKEIEIINVKLNENKIKELLNKKGFYPAYHMNKKNWISVILDDTINDNEIMSYIEESHKFTEKN